MKKINPSILQNEFIGLNIKVIDSTNLFNVGIQGKIIDETKNTFKILHNDKEKVVTKENSIFCLTLSDGTIINADGKILMGRPEDRVKKKIRTW